ELEEIGVLAEGVRRQTRDDLLDNDAGLLRFLALGLAQKCWHFLHATMNPDRTVLVESRGLDRLDFVFPDLPAWSRPIVEDHESVSEGKFKLPAGAAAPFDISVFRAGRDVAEFG